MSGKNALDKHVEDQGHGVELPSEPVQQPLFDEDQPKSGVERARGGAVSGNIEEDRAAGKGGRKKGSLNKSTGEMVRYLNTFGSGPLVGMAKIVNMVTDKGLPDFPKIAAYTGLTEAAATEFWLKCANSLAPYMHQKMPIALTVDTTSDLDLVIINADDVVGGVPSDEVGLIGQVYGDVIDVEPEENKSEKNQ